MYNLLFISQFYKMKSATVFFLILCGTSVFSQTDYRSAGATRNADWAPNEARWEKYNGAWVATAYYPGESGGPVAGEVKIMDSDSRYLTTGYNLSVTSLKIINTGTGGSSDTKIRVDAGATLTVTGNVNMNNDNTTNNNDGTLDVGGVLNINGNVDGTDVSTNDGSYNSINILNGGIISVSGNITFGSDDQQNLVYNNGTLNMTGTFTRTGAVAVSSMTDYHTSSNTVNFNGAAQTVYADVYHHLTLSGSGTKTAEGNITVNGDLTINDGITFADAGYTITVLGDVINNGTHSGTGKILLSGGSSQHVISGDAVNDFGYLRLDDTQGARFSGSGATTINGNFTITSGNMTLNAFTTSLTVVGTTSVTGTVTVANTTGTKTFSGNVTVDGSWINSANENISMGSNLTVNTGATFTAGSGVYTVSGTSKSIGGTIAALAIPSLTVTGTYTNDIDALTISTALSGTGSFTNAANNFLYIGGTSGITTLIATSAANTVDYYQAGGDQSIHATTYTNLTVTGGSTKTAAGPVNVTGVLALTNGIIITTSTNILTMKNASTTTIGSTISFIRGPMNYDMALSGTRTLNLPIGKGTDWRPAELTAVHSSATSYTYNAEVFIASAEALGWTKPGTIDIVSYVHYWDILRYESTDLATAVPSTDLSGNQTIKLYYDTNDGVTDASNLTICKNTFSATTTWIDIGGTGATVTSGSISSTSSPTTFDSFSRFTLGNRIGGINTLPIELLSFTAREVENNNVILKWSTESEINNDFFTIEKTKDGTDFTEVTVVNGAGNSNATLHYTTVDDNPYQGLSYYRLKQTDFNGKYEYSQLATVNFDAASETTIFSDPSKNNILYVSINGIEGKEIQLSIYNSLGQHVYSTTIIQQEGPMLKDIDLSDQLKPGVYSVVLTGEKEFIQKKILVQ